jgi:hypothetical protein
MPTSFEIFINTELPLRVATLDAPEALDIPVFTGVGLLTEAKTPTEIGLATLSSPAFVDTPTAPTAAPDTNTTQISTTAFVRQEINAMTPSSIGAENSVNKATSLVSPDNTKYPTTLAVTTALGDYEPVLPANVGSVKFLREDRTFQDIPAPTLTEANFSVAKTGAPTETVTWNLTALTAAKTWTIPDANINLAELTGSKSNGNTLSGTRTQILGGTNNNVSGTDNVAVNSTGCTLAGASTSVFGVEGASSIDWMGAVAIGGGNSTNTVSTCTTVHTPMRVFNATTDGVANVLTSDFTTINPTAGATNTPRHAVAHGLDTYKQAVHEIMLQALLIEESLLFSPVGNTAARYRFTVFNDTVTVDQIGTNTTNGTAFTAFTVTAAVVSGRLQISVALTKAGLYSARIKAHLTSWYDQI